MTQTPEKRAQEQHIADCVARHVGAPRPTLQERPDAIIVLDGTRRIGLEIVSTLDSQWGDAWRVMTLELRPAIEKELAKRELRCFVEYTIEVPEHFGRGKRDKSERKAWATWKEGLPAQLADLAAQGSVILGREELEAKCIANLYQVEIQPCSVPRALPGFVWMAADEEQEPLVRSRLRNKEGKLPKYLEETPDLSEVWLALFPFGPGVVETGFGELIDGNYATEFARVFLVDDRHGTIHEVTPKRSSDQ